MMAKKIKRRALFFTIDALIAALIMITGLLLMTSSYVTEQPRSTINTMSQDMLNILSELRIYEVNNSYIQALVDNGSIKDVNNTLLGQIGEFWADNNLTLAHDFAMNVSEGVLSQVFGYSIIMDNETIYSRVNPVKNSLVTSKKIITGIQKSKPIKGYIAKARATTVRKTTNVVIPFSPAGAGWKGSTASPGIVEVVKVFSLPNVTLNNATAYLSLHLDRGSTNWNVANINNGLCTITRDDMNLAPGNEGVFRVIHLNTSCFLEGNNSIRLDLRNNGYNAHIHPGTFFIINYNQTEQLQNLGWEHSERIYFDNVNSTQGGGVSGAGPWVITPFHIPTDATNISVSIQVAGRGIRDYTGTCNSAGRFSGWGGWRCKKDYDYIIFLNDEVPFASNGTPGANPRFFYSPSQTASRIVNGTNIISVYFNNYEDDYWGQNTEMIYSDQINNVSGSSFVEVNYTSPPVLPYGVIEIRQVKEFGGVENPTKDSNFSFPAEAEGVSSVFVHPVELYSYITRVYSDTGYPPGHLVFESPSSRAVPTSVYIPLETIDTTPLMLNYERIQETSGNDVLPNSTIDYGFYMRGFVGYGQVFSSQGESVEDAIARLQEVLGGYVNASDLVIENTSMSGVPSLWGPAVAEVRVWN
jgi:hypothetical protein